MLLNLRIVVVVVGKSLPDCSDSETEGDVGGAEARTNYVRSMVLALVEISEKDLDGRIVAFAFALLRPPHSS